MCNSSSLPPRSSVAAGQGGTVPAVMAQHDGQSPPLASSGGQLDSGPGSFALLPVDIVSDRAVACLSVLLTYKKYKLLVPRLRQAKEDHKAQYARDTAFLQRLSQSVPERADGRGNLQGQGRGISMHVWSAICDGKVVHLNVQAQHHQSLDAAACQILQERFKICAAIAPFEAGGLLIPSGESPEFLSKICAGLEEELEMGWLVQPHSQALVTALTNRHQLYEGFPEAPYVKNIAERFLEDADHLGRMVSGLRAAYNVVTEHKSEYRAAAESLVLRSKRQMSAFMPFWAEPCMGLSASVLQCYSRKSNPVMHEEIAWEVSQTQTHEGEQHHERMLRDYYLALHRDRLLTISGVKGLYIWWRNKWAADDCSILKHDLFEVISKKYIALNKEAQDEFDIRLRGYNARTGGERKHGRSDSGEEGDELEPKPTKPRMLKHSQAANNKLVQLVVAQLRACELDVDPFDQNPDLFNFANGVYHIRKLKFCARQQYDFCRMTSGRDWQHPAPEALLKVAALIKQVFPDPEIRRGYESILKSGFTGRRPENFVIANGGGRNGKGMLNELAVYCAREYAITAHLDLITKPMKSGANPEAAELHRKRMVIFSEPEDGLNEPLRLSNIKQLTGGNKINARLCYSNNTTTELHATIIMECNKQPAITGEKGEAAMERVRLFLFGTTFTDDPAKMLRDPVLYQPVDPTLKENKFQEAHRCAFFLYLMQHGGPEVYFPEETKALGKKYLEENDEFAMWFSDRYELDKREPTRHHISIKELHKEFQLSQMWDSMTKSEKNQMGVGRFDKTVQTNVMLKPFYVDRGFSVWDPNKNKMSQKFSPGVIHHKLKREEDADIDPDEQAGSGDMAQSTPAGPFGLFTRLITRPNPSSASRPLPMGPPAQLGAGAPQGQQRTEPVPSCTMVGPIGGNPNPTSGSSRDWTRLFPGSEE